MSTNERKQANFSVSHVWPEIIDIKCCNCKKFSESLKNGEFEKSGEKSYIIKKQVTCNCCGASAPAGTELEEVYVDADTPVKNTVASVLQVYAIINAILGVILSFVIASAADYVPIAGLLFSILPIGASFLIYSFGEVIKLLHEIKLNTRKTEK